MPVAGSPGTRRHLLTSCVTKRQVTGERAWIWGQGPGPVRPTSPSLPAPQIAGFLSDGRLWAPSAGLGGQGRRGASPRPKFAVFLGRVVYHRVTNPAFVPCSLVTNCSRRRSPRWVLNCPSGLRRARVERDGLGGRKRGTWDTGGSGTEGAEDGGLATHTGLAEHLGASASLPAPQRWEHLPPRTPALPDSPERHLCSFRQEGRQTQRGTQPPRPHAS